MESWEWKPHLSLFHTHSYTHTDIYPRIFWLWENAASLRRGGEHSIKTNRGLKLIHFNRNERPHIQKQASVYKLAMFVFSKPNT